ncbi:MAG: hypothetical protein H2076_08175 [Planctomycetes bacterium]|nr:hypothetical protein [Planctomycetota bacterium]
MEYPFFADDVVRAGVLTDLQIAFPGGKRGSLATHVILHCRHIYVSGLAEAKG